MIEYYGWIKAFHMSCVALSVSLFAGRGIWILSQPRPLWRWLRVVPHIVDTLLLASGLTLAFLIRQYPFVNSGWLTAKVFGLIAYIILGVVVFRGARLKSARWLVWATALIVFGYIVSVAVTKQSTGIFRYMLNVR
ncbi:MAG TPA: SirB2 family protein [Gammaproteobacteria bacterium]|nr:SirB2 family protein [Gammaproteobacteria bacterium]